MLRNKVFLSASSLFFTTAGIHLLRPVRDSMGITNGIRNLPLFFSVTFFLMLFMHVVFTRYQFLSTRKHRHLVQQMAVVFIPLTCFISFPELQNNKTGNYLFFAWVSVLSLYSVSIAWDTITNFFSQQQALAKFSRIAIGGSLGGVVGYLCSLSAAPYSLILALVAFLIALIFSERLEFSGREQTEPECNLKNSRLEIDRSLSFSPFLLGCFLFLYSLISTFLYLEQVWMVSIAEPGKDLVKTFSKLGLLTNVVVLILQLLLCSPWAASFGGRKVLCIIPVVLIIGIFSFILYPTILLIAVLMAFHRCSSFVFLRPAREVWFTTIDKSKKSKLKNLMDTVIYRGGDVVGSWFFIFLVNKNLTMSCISIVLFVVAIMWFLIIFHFNANRILAGRLSKHQFEKI